MSHNNGAADGISNENDQKALVESIDFWNNNDMSSIAEHFPAFLKLANQFEAHLDIDSSRPKTHRAIII